jgi:putative nucleotidyltransferase with HDIG domain
MKLSCPGCAKTYILEDKWLPSGKNLTFTCKVCSYQIKIHRNYCQKTKAPEINAEAEKTAGLNSGDSKLRPVPNHLKNQIIGGIKDLPPMPQVVIKIQQLMADPNSMTKQVSDVIESDQAIAAKVLKIANSAFYGLSGKVSSIQHASIVLGYRTLGEIVNMAAFSGALEKKMPGYGYEAEDLWKHSLAVAFISKMIAVKKNKNLVNEAHTAGLIHDVGKVVFDKHILANKDQIDRYTTEEQKTYFDAERHFFGFDHAEIASDICKKWKIPEKITLAIKCHHRPSLSNGDVLSYILHLADYIATKGGIGYDNDDVLYQFEEGAVDFLGFKQDDVREIMQQAMESAIQL